jgi:hypothetical protein
MSQIFQCGENAALVGYLYGECESEERLAIEHHLAHCAACAAELAALESARAQLASWTAPEATGVQIVRAALAPVDETRGAEPVRVERMKSSPWYRRPMPVWAQAVAATLVFGVGLSLGVLRGTRPTAPVSSAAQVQGGAASVEDLSALEERLRTEIARVQAVPATGLQPASATGLQPASATGSVSNPASPDEALLARVRALIEESERRQQRELAMRTAQVMRDVDSQRQMDLAEIQRTFGQIEGLTGAEVRQQRQMLDYLIRASEQR